MGVNDQNHGVSPTTLAFVKNGKSALIVERKYTQRLGS